MWIDIEDCDGTGGMTGSRGPLDSSGPTVHMFAVREPPETGSIQVDIDCAYTPVIIVLCSQERTTWDVVLIADTEIAGIYTSGLEEQIVTGAGGIPVEQVADVCALGMDRWETIRINEEVEDRTGASLNTLIGCPTSSRFLLKHFCAL